MKKLLLVLLLAVISFNLFSQEKDYWKIYVKNNSYEKIWVAINYKDYTYSTPEWKLKYWYVLEPGEEAYIAKTKNRYFYVYAKTKTTYSYYNYRDAYGTLWTNTNEHYKEWKGSGTYKNINGTSRGMKECYIKYEKTEGQIFTFNFN